MCRAGPNGSVGGYAGSLRDPATGAATIATVNTRRLGFEDRIGVIAILERSMNREGALTRQRLIHRKMLNLKTFHH